MSPKQMSLFRIEPKGEAGLPAPPQRFFKVVSIYDDNGDLVEGTTEEISSDEWDLCFQQLVDETDGVNPNGESL